MPCRRNIVFQALATIYTDRLTAAYSSMSNATRSFSDSIMGQAVEATPTIRIEEHASRLLRSSANVFGQVEVDAVLNCRVAASADNVGLSQDRLNELEDVIDKLLDPPVVIGGVGQIIVLPNGDRISSAGASEGTIEYPIRVRFDREPGNLEVVNG
jgi:hypothetical protein